MSSIYYLCGDPYFFLNYSRIHVHVYEFMGILYTVRCVHMFLGIKLYYVVVVSQLAYPSCETVYHHLITRCAGSFNNSNSLLKDTLFSAVPWFNSQPLKKMVSAEF